jgi:TonB-linked SusC/RagA family outer membrane protein
MKMVVLMKLVDTRWIIGVTIVLVGAFANLSHAQQTEVSGIVTNGDTGEPLAGVNILVKGTSVGTSTNPDGIYSLSVPDNGNVLVFSYIGYAKKEVTINNRSDIDVALKPITIASEELVVVGYGTQEKRDLTGSISSVSGEDVNDIPTSSLQEALQGKVAGLQVTPSSGQPGSQPIVRIRGTGTLNDASPLYVVDGLLTDDIGYVSPENVESVEVLKDASATAIYGSRGANGVIIITTTRGERGASPQISANYYFGFQQVSNRIDLANANEFATLANESAANSGNAPVFDNPDQFGAGTDYQDVIFDDMAPIQNYAITASGGGENHVYSVSGTYFKQDGVVTGANFQRGSLRLNNEYFLSDNVSFGHNLSFVYDDFETAAGDLVNDALRADPTLPPRNENGDFTNATQNGGAANPAAAIAFNENDNFGFRTAGNAYLNVTFSDNFELNSSFALDLERDQQQQFAPVFFVSPIQQNQQNRLNVEFINNTDWIIKNTLNYKQDLQDHRIDLLGGVTFQKTVFENLGGARTGFPGSNPAFFFLGAGNPSSQTNFNGSSAIGRISYIFRGNYVFKDRYLFTGTYRIDGSSVFGSENRYGFFPSVAVGWRVSDEPFFDVPEITNLKIRGSWGLVGNDKIDANSAIPTVNSGLSAVFGEGQQIVPGATVTALANPELRFEVVEQLDIGLELGLFDDRLSAEVD